MVLPEADWVRMKDELTYEGWVAAVTAEKSAANEKPHVRR